MRRSRRKVDSIASMFVLSAAMIDVFAIPLLVIANRGNHAYRAAPVVAEVVGESTETPSVKHIEVRLVVGQQPIVDAVAKDWADIPEALAIPGDRQIVVHVETSDSGQGPIADLMRLSTLGGRHGFLSRMVVVTKNANQE